MNGVKNVKRKKVCCLSLASSKRWLFHVVALQRTAKNVPKLELTKNIELQRRRNRKPFFFQIENKQIKPKHSKRLTDMKKAVKMTVLWSNEGQNCHSHYVYTSGPSLSWKPAALVGVTFYNWSSYQYAE